MRKYQALSESFQQICMTMCIMTLACTPFQHEKTTSVDHQILIQGSAAHSRGHPLTKWLGDQVTDDS